MSPSTDTSASKEPLQFQLLYLLIDLPIAAPSVLPLYPEDVLFIHVAHVIILILLALLVLPLLLLPLHLHPHLALDVHHPFPLFLRPQQAVCGCGALRAVAVLPWRGGRRLIADRGDVTAAVVVHGRGAGG
ncbi:rCG31533, isoform CRA_a [Rattus norvegicus]|uniref:RCG31533, isoform CRA_a n=1 Tax=Rattus norvegicus TaxID=10116 RepID=A6IU92_RAT|nr:rCG31533, isoform CRA_a [Rattus norvegicus]